MKPDTTAARRCAQCSVRTRTTRAWYLYGKTHDTGVIERVKCSSKNYYDVSSLMAHASRWQIFHRRGACSVYTRDPRDEVVRDGGRLVWYGTWATCKNVKLGKNFGWCVDRCSSEGGRKSERRGGAWRHGVHKAPLSLQLGLLCAVSPGNKHVSITRLTLDRYRLTN